MESITTHLLQQYVTPAPGQRLLTLGVAPALVVAWARSASDPLAGAGAPPVAPPSLAAMSGAPPVAPPSLAAGAGRGETWAIWDMLPDVLAAQQLAAQQRPSKFHALHAADLSSLAGQQVDLCVVDVEQYRSRAALLMLLGEAAALLAPGARLSLAGPNEGGIHALEKHLRATWGPVRVLAYKKGHRLLEVSPPTGVSPQDPAHAARDGGATGSTPAAWTTGGAPRPDEQAITLRGQHFTLTLHPGVFAGGALDAASVLLAEVMEVEGAARLLDLGCGSGVLGMLATRLAPNSRVALLDASAAALAAAHANCQRNQLDSIEILPSDGVAAVRERRFDVVLCNRPSTRGTPKPTPPRCALSARPTQCWLLAGAFGWWQTAFCATSQPYRKRLATSPSRVLMPAIRCCWLCARANSIAAR
jgi:16S rRNA G1207 methylase RsmC